jgi:hypothetical protein
MDIGKTRKTIQIEPVEEPATRPDPEPSAPEPTPVEPDREKVPVP